MDLNQIATFVKVFESGSFTKAAAALKQPKSRVSRAISTLERELNVTLLYRTTRQFSPTDAGRLLYEQCRPHVCGLQAALFSLGNQSQEVAGVLRVSATPDVGASLLGSLIAELGVVYPKLVIELQLADQVIDLVKERVDLALRIGSLKDSTLKSRTLGKISFIFVASPHYLDKMPRIKTLSDLTEQAILDFSRDSGDRHWKLRSNSTGKMETIRVKAHSRSNTPKVLLDLAVAGAGVALLPEFLCHEALKKGFLLRILKDYTSKKWPIQFVWPAQKVANPKIRAFVDLGVERLAKFFAPN